MANLVERVNREISKLRESNAYRIQKSLESFQGSRVRMNGKPVLMLSSNNYLGLASHPHVRDGAIKAIEKYGCGTASVRIICGYTDLHKQLEERLARFLGTEAAILYMSCSAANEGLISALMGDGDLIISDRLNHASIIDGCRLSRAKVETYAHSDMEELEGILQGSSDFQLKMIVTDGVFSMEGDIARLPEMHQLARKYDAFLVVDESHATGVLGKRGSGTVEHYGMKGKVDIQTGTLGKSLGGSAGGYVAGNKDIINFLFQKSRPIIFSNCLPPPVVGAALASLDIIEKHPELIQQLLESANFLRNGLKSLGFEIIDGETAIIPVMVRNTAKAQRMNQLLFEEGIFVQGFWFPVVPVGEERLRVQVSASHTQEDLEETLNIFQKVKNRIKGES